MAHFEARKSLEPGRVLVALTGECDLAARDELMTALLAAVASAPVVVVDVGALRFLDSTGLHGLVTAHHAAREEGGRLYVVNATGMVASVLDITGVGDLLRAPADDQLQQS
ncbi:STAS domain-containing protein [Micromonospora sp. ATA32]|nr:STAS domain-containing protein [Micromonospora sp. ATA32]